MPVLALVLMMMMMLLPVVPMAMMMAAGLGLGVGGGGGVAARARACTLRLPRWQALWLHWCAQGAVRLVDAGPVAAVGWCWC